MANSVREGSRSGTRKFWMTTPIMYASNKKKKRTEYTRTTRFGLDNFSWTILIFACLRNHTQPKETKNEKIVELLTQVVPTAHKLVQL